MEEIKQFFKALGFELVLFIAGLFGAFVSVSREKEMSLIERFTAIISGGLCANYLTPMLIKQFTDQRTISHGLAFVIGYLGMKSVQYVIEWFHRKFDNKPKEE